MPMVSYMDILLIRVYWASSYRVKIIFGFNRLLKESSLHHRALSLRYMLLLI